MATQEVNHSTLSPFHQRVYMEDTDAGGVVYYANYLKFMERARTEFIRNLGLDKESMRLQNILFVVRQVQIRYLVPAYLDDMLRVRADTAETSKCAMTFDQDISRVRDKTLTLLCRAQVQVVCVNTERLCPCPLPKEVLAEITDTGTGQDERTQ